MNCPRTTRAVFEKGASLGFIASHMARDEAVISRTRRRQRATTMREQALSPGAGMK
jgi:hypothetical protein